jgi:hypothetical protein
MVTIGDRGRIARNGSAVQHDRALTIVRAGAGPGRGGGARACRTSAPDAGRGRWGARGAARAAGPVKPFEKVTRGVIVKPFVM